MEQGRLKDRQKIERQLGRIQTRRPQLADLYRMRVIERERDGRPNQRFLEEHHTRDGASSLCTNLEGESAEEVWTQYVPLTEAAR